MARYFSEQTLLDMKDKDMNWVYDLTDLEEYLAGVPTADVAPRAEVAREIFEEIDELFRQHKEGGYFSYDVWFPERLDLDTEDAFAELKKKYTKGGE